MMRSDKFEEFMRWAQKEHPVPSSLTMEVFEEITPVFTKREFECTFEELANEFERVQCSHEFFPECTSCTRYLSDQYLITKTGLKIGWCNACKRALSRYHTDDNKFIPVDKTEELMDIEAVMDGAGVSYQRARESLAKNKNDIPDSIKFLMERIDAHALVCECSLQYT